jgi:hypothetical protein
MLIALVLPTHSFLRARDCLLEANRHRGTRHGEYLAHVGQTIVERTGREMNYSQCEHMKGVDWEVFAGISYE